MKIKSLNHFLVYLDIYKSLYMTYYKSGMDDKLNEISHLEEQLEKEQELENAGGFEGL